MANSDNKAFDMMTAADKTAVFMDDSQLREEQYTRKLSGLSYKDVKDTTVVAQFKIKGKENEFFLAWTTTPWTLLSNTALAVGPKIKYVKVQTYNQYSGKNITIILAEKLLSKWLKEDNQHLSLH